MLTTKEWLDLLHKYNISNNLIDHCIGVSNIAFNLAKQIKQKYPNLDINTNKVIIAWLLHDIWRSREWLHELNSKTILCEEWLNTIADIIIHGFLYEHFLIKWINKPEYLPTTIENKIITLSDMYYNHNNQQVTLEQRFDDISHRYYNNKEFLQVIELAKPRFRKLEKEIQNLL